MTPFDPWALLAMLEAFYPVVSVPELQRARRERPEYFAGGTLGGSKGDKLFLPDGRVWDLILAAGAAAGVQRWIAIEVTDAGPDGGDGLTLEPGPLTPIDVALIFPPFTGEAFESLVARHLADVGSSDAVLDRAAVDVVELGAAAALDGSYDRHVAPALEHHAATRAALDLDDPSEELEAAGLTRDTIDAALTEYDEDPPADLPEDDPGDPPRDEEDDKGPDGREIPQ